MSVAIFTPTPDINKRQMSLCNNTSDNKKLLNTQGRCQSICTSHHCHIYAPITSFITFTLHLEVDPLSYFSFQPVLHDWCNKGYDMYYPVCGMMHIKEPLLLLGKSSLCGGSGFSLSLSEWSFTICLTPYNRK